MAKLSMIVKENKRKDLVAKFRFKREELKKNIRSLTVDFDKKMESVKELSELKRDSSNIRVRSRCQICGRPRAVYKKFGLCRIHLREAVMRGDVPGVVKASW